MSLFAVILACTPPHDHARLDGSDPTVPATSTPATTSNPGTSSNPGTGTTAGTSGVAVDETTARDVISGAIDPDEGFSDIAWSGGFPVATETGWLFLLQDGGNGWMVAGDFDGWAGEPLQEGANGVWWAEVPIANPAGSHYKFAKGNNWIADPWARSYTYDDNGEISYVRPPTDTWRLDRWPGFFGEGLAPRTVEVYVPPGTGPFPVLYAEDGNNLFNPDAFWGGWRLQEALATVDPMVVVGIDNTMDRMDEYTHTPDDIGYGYPIGGNGTAYATFITEDVRPQIESVYGSTGLDGLLGSSLGGLISLYIAHQYPADWDFAASMSGTLGWGRFKLENPVMEELFLGDAPGFTKIYVDSGGSAGSDGQCDDRDGDGFTEDDGGDADNYCVNRQFADDLAAAGWTFDENLWHWWEPDAEHSEVYWADRVDQPLGIFAGLDD